MTSDPGDAAASTVSEQYQEHGEEYLDYQLDSVETANQIAVTRFLPYVGPEDRVVDFGCGTGWLLKLLPAGEKLGIEPNPAARSYAATIGTKTVASAEEIEDGWADVIVSNHALEHSLSPFDELVRLKRVLKPGGRLVFCLPIDDFRKPSHRRPDGTDPNHHLFTWTPLLITNLLQEAGYEVEHARSFTYLQPYYNDVLYPRLPRPIFDLLAKIFGRIMRYHQLLVVAKRP